MCKHKAWVTSALIGPDHNWVCDSILWLLCLLVTIVNNITVISSHFHQISLITGYVLANPTFCSLNISFSAAITLHFPMVMERFEQPFWFDNKLATSKRRKLKKLRNEWTMDSQYIFRFNFIQPHISPTYHRFLISQIFYLHNSTTAITLSFTILLLILCSKVMWKNGTPSVHINF